MPNLIHGECLHVLRTFENDSLDSMVTDPPAGISFMNKGWDTPKNFIPFMTEVMSECLRVLKPGAHALVWALSRTSHWTATALKQAGFEIRDVITHLFGSGFPKSKDISKAIDKDAGAERIVTKQGTPKPTPGEFDPRCSSTRTRLDIPATELAAKWQGWGTNLKPASEHWILVRKPIAEDTIAKNVSHFGTGAINIDACRIGTGEDKAIRDTGNIFNGKGKPSPTDTSVGRFPANLILDDAILGEASRFFYCAKASTSERNKGLEAREPQKVGDGRHKEIDNPYQRREILRHNTHPTVKAIKLMTYLVTLVTPPGGRVLDPFMGSGSTGIAALTAGFEFTGIEREQEYFEIATKRISTNI